MNDDLFQMLSKKRDDLVAVDVVPGFFAEGVVAAGQDGLDVWDLTFAKCVHCVE
ncbi:MAG TPA: hypothetical protein PKA82_01175 [Pyrinomonadaceae bacterium]|nr:hypothetical protein [Pyrinomonadaceae bacterium]